MTGAIVFLGVIVALLAAALVLVFILREKLRGISRSFFGTDDFREGLLRTQQELSTTPQSVTSMTRLMEPQIMRDFPDFSWPQFRSRAQNLITEILTSIDRGSVGSLGKDASDELREQIRNHIADLASRAISEHYAAIKVHQTEIANYRRAQGKCIITVQSAVAHIHYQEQDTRVIQGSRDIPEQTRYNLELVYIQDADVAGSANAMGTTCPNCGAPIKSIGSFRCEYCGMAVTPVNAKVWRFERFHEVDYRHV